MAVGEKLFNDLLKDIAEQFEASAFKDLLSKEGVMPYVKLLVSITANLQKFEADVKKHSARRRSNTTLRR